MSFLVVSVCINRFAPHQMLVMKASIIVLTLCLGCGPTGVASLHKHLFVPEKLHRYSIIASKIPCLPMGENQESGELIMDNNDLERERGITLLSKNISVTYKDVKINVIDTPGHADFGGEVERVLKMADGVVLLVDAFEGAMPQTRFVLQKALELELKAYGVINKVDKPNCRPEEVHDQVFDLFFNLDATEEQLDFPTFYGSSKQGWFNSSLEQTDSILPLLDGILEYVPEP
ncbi:hypothetical protein FQR65_LT18066 [Abscondita terminalis]|nr:hypothetical protein FQR65_LT18066 [Abscondita terminalis]